MNKSRRFIVILATLSVLALIISSPVLAGTSRSYPNTSSSTVDNATRNRPVTVGAADFPTGSVVTDVNVYVRFEKRDTATCTGSFVPPGGPVHNEEIAFWLIGPDGTRVNLINPGTYTGNTHAYFQDVTLDDAAATTVGGGTPASGTFKPVEALSAYNGKNPIGIWTLYIQDTATGAALCYNQWTLFLTANAAPVATGESYSTNEDTALTVPAPGVLVGDTDGDTDALTAVLGTTPTHGVVTLNPDGSFTYTPAPGYHGPDSFTYTASDGTASSAPATVSLNVNSVNDVPVAANDSYTTAAGVALNQPAPGVLANDTDADGDPLTAALVTGPAHGTLTLSPDGSFSYTPTAGYSGADSFSYTASDGQASSGATVSLTVTPPANTAPVAADDSYSTAQDTPLGVAAPGVLGNDTDADGDPLTAYVVTGPAHGTVTLGADGAFSYTPTAGYSGADSFTYKANDGTADSNTATVSLTVTPPGNSAPVAANDSYSTAQDTPLNQAAPGVLANDTDANSDPLTAALVAGPTHGTLTLNPNGSFLYTPAAGYNGADSFTYMANDGAANSNTATVSLTVTAPGNTAPVAANDSYSTAQDTPLNIAAPGVLGNDTDANSDPLTAALVAGPASGILTLNPNGSFDYTPNAGFSGADSFTYMANDGAANSNTATVTITVGGSGPVIVSSVIAVDDTSAAPRDQSVDIDVLANDGGTGKHLTGVSSPAHGTAEVVNGAVRYTPAAGYSGDDYFQYSMSSSQGNGHATVMIRTWAPIPQCADYNGTKNEIVRAGVADGTVDNAGVFCRILVQNGEYLVNGGEIGIESIIDLGVLQAVEVFGVGPDGYATSQFWKPVSICLMGNGKLIYLSAANQPRVPSWLASTSSGGFTCGTISYAGTVILVP